MNKKEIVEVVKKDLEPYFLEQGFEVAKISTDVLFKYVKKDKYCAYSLGGTLLRYDKHILMYGFSFGINQVIDTLRLIDNHVKLQKVNPYNINDTFIGISPGAILFPKDPARAYKSFGDSFELELVLYDIIAFHMQYYLDFCNKYKDISKLDKLYNRLDDFKVEGDSFPNLAFFHVTRLIIARLANNPDYEKVVEKNFEALEYLWEQDGGKYDRFDETKPEVFAAKYLRDLKV